VAQPAREKPKHLDGRGEQVAVNVRKGDVAWSVESRGVGIGQRILIEAKDYAVIGVRHAIATADAVKVLQRHAVVALDPDRMPVLRSALGRQTTKRVEGP